MLRHAEVQMLELFYNFFDRFVAFNNFQEIDKDTDSLHLGLAENMTDCIRSEMNAEGTKMRLSDYNNTFEAYPSGVFFPTNVLCTARKT